MAAIEELLASPVNTKEAHGRVAALIQSLPEPELKAYHDGIQRLIGKFQRKKRRELELLVQVSLGVPVPVPVPAHRLEKFEGDLAVQLDELSTRHIFKWSTHYSRVFSWCFTEALTMAGSLSVAAAISRHVGRHASEIFTKGYDHNTSVLGVSREDAVAKSLNGLSRFLDIPIRLALDFSRVGDAKVHPHRIASAMILGIVRGFSEASVGQFGASLLPRHSRRWAHCLAFMDAASIEALDGYIESGPFERYLGDLVQVVRAVDRFREEHPGLYVAASEWEHRVKRLLLVLHVSPKNGDRVQLDVQVFLDPSEVRKSVLAPVLRTAPALVAARLHAGLFIKDMSLNTSVVDLESPEASIACMSKLRAELEREQGSGRDVPRANYAQQFPLEKSRLGQGFLVERESVRALLDDVRENYGTGISLWTSIRRSGKTTAARALASHLGAGTIIYQTMQQTELYPERHLFAQRLQSVLEGKGFLPADFFRRLVQDCAENLASDGRTVVILDEYERLFRILKDSARDERLRLRVCSPLLSQMTEFAQDNLLVLLGMDPTAHFIMMDENQLSAYVRRVHFPLFSHAAGGMETEFADFVSKVLTGHLRFDDSFCDRLHELTAGHPYLTVNALRDLLDWMIEDGVPVGDRGLSRDTLEGYLSEVLTDRRIRRSQHFAFFLNFTKEALGIGVPTRIPWLTAAFRVLKATSRHGALPAEQALSIVRSTSDTLIADEVVESAVSSNILTYRGEQVYAAIPLLARVAKATGG